MSQDVVKENGMMVKESLGDLKRLNINALELANSTQEQPKPNSLSTFKHREFPSLSTCFSCCRAFKPKLKCVQDAVQQNIHRSGEIRNAMEGISSQTLRSNGSHCKSLHI